MVKTTPKVVKPPKNKNIVTAVRRYIEDEKYIATKHAKERLDQRKITMPEVRRVLEKGKRNAAKDEFHKNDDKGNEINRWSYAFEGETIDKRKLRVCVSEYNEAQNNELLLIITVIQIK